MCSKRKKPRLDVKESLNNVEDESEREPKNATTSAIEESSETSSEESTSADESESEETATAPYSMNLEYDIHLRLSNKDIKKKIQKNKYFKKVARKSKFELLQLEALGRPSTKQLAQFAAKCFENSHRNESKDGLPRGWKMLTTASNIEYGYFGIAYINIKKLQVVIAHRGTENTNDEPYKTHFQAILDRCHKQVRSAVTFAYDVIKELDEFRGRLPARFQLFFTGHGFGGWLAQIAAFSAQYLVKDRGTEDVFLKRENADDGYLVHTEVFDSVGCEDLLIKLVDDFDVRYEDKKIDLNNLDITNFFVSPNVINCLKKHIGNVVLISKPDSGSFSLNDQYYQDSSSLQLILDYLKSCSHNMRVVMDWPVNEVLPVGDECETLFLPTFKWLDNCAIPNTNTEAFVYAQRQSQGYFPVRYQTKPFKEDTCKLSVFTLTEQKFLKHFQWIRGVPEYFKPITFFKDILPPNEINPNYVLEQLQYLEIKSGKVKLLCDSGSSLGQYVSFVKRLLEFYPKLIDEAEKSLTYNEVRKFAYKNESIEYSNKLEKMTDLFSDKCGLSKDVKNFVKTDLQTLQIRTSNDCDTDVVTAMINKLLKRHDHYLVMRLQNVVALSKSVSLKEVLMSEAFGKVLLVLDCNLNPDNSDEDEVKEFFKKLVKVLINPKVKPNVKLIVISEIRTDITTYLEKLTKKKFKDAAKIVDFEGLKWTDLTSDAKEILLSKNLVIFQGSDEVIPLKILLGKNDVIQDIIDNATIMSLMKDRLIQIGNQVPNLGTITNSYVPRVFRIDFQVKANVLFDIENTRDIIAVSGNSIEDYPLIHFGVKKYLVQICDEGNFNVERGRIFILGENDSEHFCNLLEQVGISRIVENVHWLILELDILKWKETHGSVDFIKQNLNHNEDVITVFDKLYDYTDFRKTHNWEETEIENVRSRIKSLVISDTAGMGKTTALTIISLKIKSNNPSLWVISINLNDCTENFKEVCKDFNLEKFGNPNVSNAVDFLIEKIMNCNDNTKLSTTLEKIIFKQKLIDSGGVVLLFDAFDEICPNYESVFIELLSVLMKTKVTNIFVTSRPFSKDQIETVLKTHCFVMEQFKMDDQVKFLVNTWLKNANSEASDDLKNKAKKLIDVFRTSIHDFKFASKEETFTGVPLQCWLIAKVYEDTIISNISSNISLVSLYEAFEQKKIEIYENEKRKSTRGDINLENSDKLALRQLRQFHGQLALAIMCENEDSAPIEMQDFEPEIKKILEVIALKVGLVVRVKTPIQFVHRTFAEFFVAKFFINALEKPHIPESIVQAIMTEILIDRRYNMVRAFFNGYLKNLTDYSSVVEHFSVAFSKLFQANSNIFHWSYNENRTTAFHMAIDDNLKEVFKFLVDFCLNMSTAETLVGFINAVNIVFETPTVFALIKTNSDSKELLDYLLGKIRGSSNEVQRMYIIGNMINPIYRENFTNYIEEHAGDIMMSTAVKLREKMYLITEFSDAAERGNVKDLQYIFKQAGDNKDRHFFMLACNPHFTALDNAVMCGRLEAAKFLMEQEPSAVKLLLSRPGNKLLVHAMNSGSEEIVQLIFSRLSESNHILQDRENIALIIDWNRDDMLSILLDLGLDTTVVKFTKYYHDSLLGYAIREGKIKIVEKILSHGVDVNRRQKNSDSAVLHRSVFSKNPEGVSLLLKHGALVNAVDKNGNTPLHEAAKNTEGISPSIVNIILNGGGNLNAVNHRNETPFDVALSMGNIGALVALLPLQPFVTSLDHDSRKFFWAKSLELKLGLTKEKLKSLGLEIDEGGRFIHCDFEELFDCLAITADYFVADYLISGINDIHHEHTYVLDLMIDIIVKDKFDVMKKFFNQLLYCHEFEEEILHRIGDILHQRFLQQMAYDEENACNISLHQLVSDYQERILDFLLNCFKDTPLFLHHLTSLNKYKQTALYLTIDEEYIELSNIILNSLQNCDPRDRKTILEATLHQDYAMQERIKPLTKLMENFDFLEDIRKEFEETSQTLLKLNDAAINGKLDQLKDILQEANTEMRNRLPFASKETRDFRQMHGDERTYYTALNLAVDGGHFESVTYLIEKGFHLNPPYSDEWFDNRDEYWNEVCTRKIIIPPLLNAVKNENIIMIKNLLENGAIMNDYYTCLPPLKVAVYFKFSEIVEFLLNCDENIEDLDDCLLLASEKGYSNIVIKLLNAGANVNHNDEDNFTPLHHATSHRNVDAVSAMLQKGAIINVQNSDGDFPLHIAAEKSSVEVVSLLLDKGAQVNVVNENEDTPLHLAVIWNSSDVVACLIEKGADIEAMDFVRRTPLDIKPSIIRYKDES